MDPLMNQDPLPPAPERRLGAFGYTTVELIIAMFIMGTVIFSALQVYKMVQRSYWQVDEKSQLERIITFTMDQMVQQVRQTSKIKTLSATTGTVLANQTVHLDAAGSTICSITIPNMSNGVSQTNDATLWFFLRTMPDGSIKLFQRMKYYNGAYTEAFPVMASTDEYRLGNPPVATPGVEPAPGTATPTPSAANTPTPTYNLKLGRMAGAYNISRYNFDDVSFYYDNTNQILAIGMVVSIKSQSLTWFPSTLSRRRLYLTSSVALRNLAQ